MLKSKSFVLYILFSVVLLSCKDQVINNYDKNITIQDSLRVDNYDDIVDVVTNNPESIISYTDLENFQRGTVMKLRVNRKGFEVWEVAVIFDALYRQGNEKLILCHTLSVFPVGAGDSGSPLLTTNGKIAGILCYGYWGNSNDFVARAIEDVISIDSNSVSANTKSSLFNTIQPVYVVSGIDDQAVKRYSGLGSLFEKAAISNEFTFPKENKFFKQTMASENQLIFSIIQANN